MKASKSFVIAFSCMCLQLVSCTSGQDCKDLDLKDRLDTFLITEIEKDPGMGPIEDLKWKEIYLGRFINEDIVLENPEVVNQALNSCNCKTLLTMSFKLDPEVVKFMRLQGESSNVEQEYHELRLKKINLAYTSNHESETGFSFCENRELLQVFKEYVVLQHLNDQIEDIINNIPQHKYNQDRN